MNRTHIACYNTNCTYFSMELMGKCLNGTWMSNLYYSMPLVTTLVTMNGDVEGDGGGDEDGDHEGGVVEAGVGVVGITGDDGGRIGSDGDSYLGMELVRYLGSFDQLNRVATFYILQLTRRLGVGSVLSPKMLAEIAFSTAVMGWGMFYYQWKFYGE